METSNRVYSHTWSPSRVLDMNHLQSKESKRCAEHHMLGLGLEGRGGARELRWRRRANRSCTSRQERWPQSRGDGVRRSSRCGWSLRGCNAGHEANRCSRSGPSDHRLGGEVHLRDGKRSGTVHNRGDRHAGGWGAAGRRRVDRRTCGAHTTSGRSRSIVKGVVGAVSNEARVLGNVLRADAHEVLELLLGLLVRVTSCLYAVDDVLGELGVLAVAVRGSVVLAVLRAYLQPCVHAGGENLSNGWGRVAWARWLRRGARHSQRRSTRAQRRGRWLGSTWGRGRRGSCDRRGLAGFSVPFVARSC
jgi:hypothetical protein